MFDDNSQSKPKLGATVGAGGIASSQPQTPTATYSSPLASSEQPIYTMPEKFMPPKHTKSSGGGKKWLLIFGVVISILAIGAAIVVYALYITSEPTVDNNAAVQNANTNQVENNNAKASTNENSNNANVVDNSNGGIGSVINLNDNDNVNDDFLNGNDNSNSSTNGNTNTAESPFIDKSKVTLARDKDKDKLTDEEEELYGTLFDKPDTDKDGFIDGSEVINGFSPTDAEETLLNSGLVIQYENEDYGWHIDYPANWFAEPVGAAGDDVLFTSDSVEGELIEVVVVENTKEQSAAQWFASLYSDIDPSDLESVTVAGLKGIVSPDGFTYYIADDLYIIGVIYNFGAKTEIHFSTTFEMMVRSFKYTEQKKAKVKTDTNENSNSNDNANTNSTNSNTNSNTNTNVNSNTNGSST
ncbi:MAG: hypothetical protein COW24_03225 [Candidatus Kerfeldbacteria bacterium CG15_BIG_FIL_POST_REV_8_21_14_020_45_12]|uniref:EF-hand domain-containing protein n=1 Tax=Candidatus Kerfeldbacteria bacterium CG15_BIG_FIL_POST_REV_8_21_14_020_45_12 TaxID=2014247 RepID=A0A2M7H3M4_9BACT|nr:MAG: hypothetical protein COW24_03225 [Candidatus Kerfeldbacteria bacterium CG15_BIG_FIL_POST_REV_8_21_14_020_45_12]PJA93443.1 MAG: hypothetical protein CO132_03030 [Candidatus Kerfeldbacteria bacterium CG_4_9_14_3_um_filter_45_8]